MRKILYSGAWNADVWLHLFPMSLADRSFDSDGNCVCVCEEPSIRNIKRRKETLTTDRHTHTHKHGITNYDNVEIVFRKSAMKMARNCLGFCLVESAMKAP